MQRTGGLGRNRAAFFENREEIKNTIKYDLPRLKEFEADGIIQVSDDKITVSEEGLIFIRNVAASFDPLLTSTTKTFSKSV
ncbi:hypothetical protein MASR2M47_15230 [Draconibacterium sp.]